MSVKDLKKLGWCTKFANWIEKVTDSECSKSCITIKCVHNKINEPRDEPKVSPKSVDGKTGGIAELKKRIEAREVKVVDAWDEGFNAGLRAAHQEVEKHEAEIRKQLEFWYERLREANNVGGKYAIGIANNVIEELRWVLEGKELFPKSSIKTKLAGKQESE